MSDQNAQGYAQFLAGLSHESRAEWDKCVAIFAGKFGSHGEEGTEGSSGVSRYEVADDGIGPDIDRGCGVIRADEYMVGGPFAAYTHTEASIIAWALNAVAEGWTLAAIVESGDSPAFFHYNGPTDGVAPEKEGA